MPDTNQEPVINESKVSETEVDYQKFVEAAEAAKAEAAKEIAGLNRRISQMEKELKNAELAKLSESERAKAEIELARVERDNLLKETAKIKLDLFKEKSLVNMGIPANLAKHINGNTEEEITLNVKEFKDYMDSVVNQKITETTNQILAGKVPSQSTPPAGTITRAAYEALSQVDKTNVLKAKTKIVN